MKALTMIANAACVYGLKLDDIRGPARHKEVSDARKLAVYVVRRDAGLSFPGIGRLIRRYHSTAIYLYREAQAEINARGPMADKLAAYDKAVGK